MPEQTLGIWRGATRPRCGQGDLAWRHGGVARRTGAEGACWGGEWPARCWRRTLADLKAQVALALFLTGALDIPQFRVGGRIAAGG